MKIAVTYAATLILGFAAGIATAATSAITVNSSGWVQLTTAGDLTLQSRCSTLFIKQSATDPGAADRGIDGYQLDGLYLFDHRLGLDSDPWWGRGVGNDCTVTVES